MKMVIKLLVMVALAIVLMQPEVAGPAYAQGKVLKKSRGNDIAISANPNVDEFNPTVAANPINVKQLVAGSQYDTDTTKSCVAYASSDGGLTWTAPATMPLLSAISQCSNPVVAYAPDGSRVFYAYMDIKSTVEETEFTITRTDDWDVLVSTSDDNGMTWTAPAIALNGMPSSSVYDLTAGEYVSFQNGLNYDLPWISTPQNAAEKDWVYVTATRFDSKVEDPADCYISFAHSGDAGLSWNEPVTLDQSTNGCYFTTVVQGSRPAGGTGSDVLTAWYHSGSDGYQSGEFEIRTRYSTDHGDTWNDIVTAVTDSYERPFFLIPNPYFRLWGIMFPDVEIDAQGGAHIAYTHDPQQDANTAENGDIRYIQSSGPPYNSWSTPVTVNDDGLDRTQGWPALETRVVKKKVYVYLMWADFRLSPAGPATPPNPVELNYDIFFAVKRAGSSHWSKNQRITDVSSLAEIGPYGSFFGEYIDLAANSDMVYGVWTDRRDKTDTADLEDDIFGSVLP